MTPIYIQDVMRVVVELVSTKILTKLQAIDEAITAVHFQYGTGKEIIETLEQLTLTNCMDKYPLVCLFLDVDEEMNQQVGIYSNMPRLRIAICTGTSPTYKAATRDEKTFKPILTPIYLEMLKQMEYIGFFQYPNGGFPHQHKRNYFWGREGVYGKEATKFNDMLDAIEITFTNIKLLTTDCEEKLSVLNQQEND